MARLACVKHQSRVLVLEDRVIHRADRTLCKSVLKIGDKKFTADQIRAKVHQTTSLEEQTII